MKEVIRYAILAVAAGLVEVFSEEESSFAFVQKAGRLVALADKDNVSASEALTEIGSMADGTWGKEILLAIKEARLPVNEYDFKKEEEGFRDFYEAKTEFPAPYIKWGR